MDLSKINEAIKLCNMYRSLIFSANGFDDLIEKQREIEIKICQLNLTDEEMFLATHDMHSIDRKEI